MDAYLKKLCVKGFQERYPKDDGSAQKRMDYELGIIRQMGYSGYFLIVWDFINYCRTMIYRWSGPWQCRRKHCCVPYRHYGHRSLEI